MPLFRSRLPIISTAPRGRHSWTTSTVRALRRRCLEVLEFVTFFARARRWQPSQEYRGDGLFYCFATNGGQSGSWQDERLGSTAAAKIKLVWMRQLCFSSGKGLLPSA